MEIVVLEAKGKVDSDEEIDCSRNVFFSGEMSSDLEIAVQYVDFILRWVRTSDDHTSNLYPYSYVHTSCLTASIFLF